MVINSLKHCQRFKGLEIHGWCLMPDTLYLIVRSGDGRGLSGIIRDLKNYTSKKIVEIVKEIGTPESEDLLRKFKKAASKNRKPIEFKVWHDGYYPDELFTMDYIVKKLNYIHIAPVEHKIVCKMYEYEYSSAKNYMDKEGLLEVIRF